MQPYLQLGYGIPLEDLTKKEQIAIFDAESKLWSLDLIEGGYENQPEATYLILENQAYEALEQVEIKWGEKHFDINELKKFSAKVILKPEVIQELKTIFKDLSTKLKWIIYVDEA